MSAPVDVLAVMDHRIAVARRFAAYPVEGARSARAVAVRKDSLAAIEAERAAVAELIEQQKRDAQLVAVLLSYVNDALSTSDKSRLVTELANRGLADHDAQRRAALARVGGAT